MIQTDSPRLLWDARGEIACEAHAPFAGTDTRVWGGWRAITPREAEAFEREAGKPVECETCRAERRNR